ncbi:MAG: LysM peptidoglycan-binding domain-containing protein [Planctomycetota bacterium]
MAVTLPYKIALGCSLALLLFALGVRLMGGGDALPTGDGPEFALANPEAETVEDSEADADVDDAASPEGDRTSLQAPSKAPPTLPDALAMEGDEAMGSDAEPVADPVVEAEAPPTLVVGRAADDAGPSPIAAVDTGDEMPDDSADTDIGETTLQTYTVRSGDTFESIARRELGSTSRWVALAKANPTVDPLKLRVGEVLRLPSDKPELDPSLAVIPDEETNTATNAQLPPPPDPVTYVVRSGDSLSTIAARFYADSSRWQAIFNANRDQLKSPHAVRIGMELRIPPAIAAAPGSLEN